MPKTIEVLRDKFAQSKGLPYSNLLPKDEVEKVLNECKIQFRKRVFDPITTAWMFVSQVLDSDHGTNAAVSRLLAHRLINGEKPCSASNSAYCQARQRLPLELLQKLSRRAARRLDKSAHKSWLWKGRHVLIVDGTTISMPDTEENQAAFPQPKNQKPGLGNPIMRLVAVFSLSTGAVSEIATGKYRGKQQGESSLFRRTVPNLPRGGVMLADKYYDSYWTAAYLWERDIDLVCQAKAFPRKSKYKRGQKVPGRYVGNGDMLFTWYKPQRPKWMSRTKHEHLPKKIEMRAVVINVSDENSRQKQIVVYTTLTDHKTYTKEDIAELYRKRWNCELDLRSLKSDMQMDRLRCKTPEMVYKEIWAHILAYNLMRGVMTVAAKEAEVKPRSISFKGTMQLIFAIQTTLQYADPEKLPLIFHDLMLAIASKQVGNRPGRWEPREIRRRPKPHKWMTTPRAVAKEEQRQKLMLES